MNWRHAIIGRDVDVMSRFDEIKKGLLEAIAYERGEMSENITIHKMSVASVKDSTPSEIKGNAD